jgi:hypothetical protein
MPNIVPIERVTEKIYLIRGMRVMLDRDLAKLYGVETKVFKQAVKRNINRFPEDFMFELTGDEFKNLRSQFVTSSWGGPRYVPMAFTEQGVAMLSSVLTSDRAVQVNIQIMRAFIKMRQMYISHEDLKKKIIVMERKYDKQFQIVFEAIKQLIEADEKPRRKIGYVKAPKTSSGKKKKTMCLN